MTITAMGVTVLFWLFVMYSTYTIIEHYRAGTDPIPALAETGIAFLCSAALWAFCTQIVPLL